MAKSGLESSLIAAVASSVAGDEPAAQDGMFHHGSGTTPGSCQYLGSHSAEQEAGAERFKVSVPH